MKRITLAFLVLCLVLASGAAFGAPKTIKLAHLNPQQPFDVSTAAMSAVFKSMVEAESNGDLLVTIFPAGQLGNERETMEQVKLGVVQSYIASAGGMAAFYPLYSIVDIPFAIPNYDIAWKVYDGPFGDHLAKEIEDKAGFKVLGYGEAGGFFQLSNNQRPIQTVADMKGLKMRTMTLPSHQNLMRAYGAAATPVAWAEVYTALQTGVVDGQHNPIPIVLTGKLFEVQKYLTITNHLYSSYCWVMNKDFYQGLTEKEKEIVDSAARTAIVAGRGLNRIIESSEKGLPALAEAGMEINTPSPEALQEFREVGLAAAMEFIKETYKDEGVALAQMYLEAIDEAMEEGK
ncbi:MAG TPA: DctP family TRAP transporter solute-binding subunit [Synergistaceae bacterium]|nr:DctP family TRAP transporter solute-binding subunit [Synergistaceae bacterium]HPQ36894.1 DctP family TRAP transporter solute-binding subunit [Synergistaceae bacterium]